VNTQALIQAMLDASNREDLDAVAELVHEDFVGTVPPTMSAEPDTYEGRAGARRYFELWRDIADRLVATAQRYEPAGEWTITFVEVTGTALSSGVPIEDEVVLAVLPRDGLLFRIEAFPSAEEARAELERR
jgi:ketosteroid isomerase-like protein